MKIKWSVTLSFALLILAGCGKEQFGSTPQTNASQAEPVKQFEQHFCAKPTIIPAKVDILYLVDNSPSTYFIANDIKNAITNTVNSVSSEFDYRLIGAPLIATDDTPFNDYQLLTNSQDYLSQEASGKKIISSNELNFFMSAPAANVNEAGLKRAIDFINANVTNSSGLFRPGANLIIVVFSNGRDMQIEQTAESGGPPIFNATLYSERVANFNYIKNELLDLRQLRLFSVTARSACNPGWFSSLQSYIKMSQDLYRASNATDSPTEDNYDLCSGVANVFAPVNQSIKKVILQNTHRYWPISFANSSHERNDFGEIEVFKIDNGSSQLIPSENWNYYEHTGAGPLNIREPASPGGEADGKHFIRFENNSLITSPTCVQIKSSTRTEYFGYVVLHQEPKPESIALRINGQLIPKSSTDGWTYVGSRLNQNIKMPHPNAGDQFPAVYKSGFLLQLNGTNHYYQSGDSVEATFIAAPL